MPDASYRRIFELNRRWVEERNHEDPTFFEKLAREQNPDFLFIGCADSRVPASTIMGVEPGEVFVHRNVANLVVNTDLNVASTINYAVDHLKVRHIVVCGHYGCGGVQAAMQPRDLGVLNGWLREIRDVYRLHKTELDAIADQEQRYRRLVELNVREQCINVIKTAEVQRNYLERGAPLVHGWVYDLSSGYLQDLEIGFEALLDEVREIYSLTPGSESP
ncbi:carbonic anhydrase [Lujinxingia litoralis]|uniref:Carbonic anhydrase 2 n=1 Tax=Lujinxingia litoralis TaxID=2211119 RepID=A0A328CB86_9DELT|nr:carbonic anhydrase [Lujinxingia litoralis]RAL25114.1 carbonic anhydrase [Lujinxingia litoralis]